MRSAEEMLVDDATQVRLTNLERWQEQQNGHLREMRDNCITTRREIRSEVKGQAKRIDMVLILAVSNLIAAVLMLVGR